jgi:hypothetical protein
MDFNTTIDIILKDLREVREIIEDMKNYPGIPLLQVELAKSKCRSAEEVIALLKTLKPVIAEGNAAQAAPPSKEVVPEKRVEPEKPEILMEISDDEEVQNQIPEIENPEKMIFQNTVPPEKKSPSRIYADKFTEPGGTFSDKFATAKTGEDLASVINKNNPIINLSDAIGISDKFLFINEVFRGNRSDYEQALEKLNHAGNVQDAMAIIMSYTGENELSEVVRQLLDIVKRKLPSDG